MSGKPKARSELNDILVILRNASFADLERAFADYAIRSKVLAALASDPLVQAPLPGPKKLTERSYCLRFSAAQEAFMDQLPNRNHFLRMLIDQYLAKLNAPITANPSSRASNPRDISSRQ